MSSKDSFHRFFETVEKEPDYKDEAIYFMEKLLNDLYNRMKTLGMTQKILADKLGVTPSAISQFFGCYEGNLSINKIFHVAKSLNFKLELKDFDGGSFVTVSDDKNEFDMIADVTSIEILDVDIRPLTYWSFNLGGTQQSLQGVSVGGVNPPKVEKSKSRKKTYSDYGYMIAS